VRVSCTAYTIANPPFPSGFPRTYRRVCRPCVSSLVAAADVVAYVSVITRGHFTCAARSFFVGDTLRKKNHDDDITTVSHRLTTRDVTRDAIHRTRVV
jgi:hypothetical protein